LNHRYPKRLIEVDLPIKRISAHARREKSIRHGHISTLHIWWARRPLAACRAVICASLWPDPADDLCPEAFTQVARVRMLDWAREHLRLASPESAARMVATQKDPDRLADPLVLRRALLDFIADFANWDNSTVPAYLETSRALTQAAHEALGGVPGTRPLVVDPFAGGGSIPLEALRVGADTFASDLNPVAVLLNKVVLEYIPKYGQRLADEVRKWGEWIKREAEKELAEFYPKDPDGATPIAYLWARTIQCEGPGCGAEVPLIRSLWLANKSTRSIALQLVPRPKAKRVDFRIIRKECDGWVDQDQPRARIEDPKFDGTVKRGSATCPCCGYTTPIARIRDQLRIRHGGANDAILTSVVTTSPDEQGRRYRLPEGRDLSAVRSAKERNMHEASVTDGGISPRPVERVNKDHHDVNRLPMYGMETWADAFTSRQLVALCRFQEILKRGLTERNYSNETALLLALALDRLADYGSSVCRWVPRGEYMGNSFGRQALQMVWDFAEVNPFSGSTGDLTGALDWIAKVVEREASALNNTGVVAQGNATSHPYPNDSASAFITDPPYFDAIDYGVISDFFYVWLRRSASTLFPSLFTAPETPKDEQVVVNANTTKGTGTRDEQFFRAAMMSAMGEGRRVTAPGGIGVVVFAHKSTAGWESQLSGMLEAGWIVTASWPIDTEMGERLVARGSASLASSIHLVCRPREHPDGSVRGDDIGAWRDVLAELPVRIHDWMPRLAEEGVVGADAIFACLGPALEIFSRYARVEKANGETVTLKEYLEQVWAAVAKEALSLVFAGADTARFEPDARLTAMWLWTLSAGANADAPTGQNDLFSDAADDEEPVAKGKLKGGFALEYDAARKIAQGLGAHLEELPHLVEIKGDQARLLPVSERTKHLFGKDEAQNPTRGRGHKKPVQGDLFADLKEIEEEVGWGATGASKAGETALDRIHQGMILFAAGRSEALKRFLVDDGAGRDQRFWGLAQALSALYPAQTEEKRWVDGVLARKKSLGF
jgi:adenine-specific DNA methylase